MPIKFLEENDKKFVRNVYALKDVGINKDFGGQCYVPITNPPKREGNKIILNMSLEESNPCPYLNGKLRCDVYEKRPEICKYWGTKEKCPEQVDVIIYAMEVLMHNIKKIFTKKGTL